MDPNNEAGHHPAFLFGEGDGGKPQPWDPAFGSFPLELALAPVCGNVDNVATNPRASPVRHAAGSTSCAAQAGHASRISSSLRDRDAEWLVPVANEIGPSVSPSALSNIARLYAATRPCRPEARNPLADTHTHHFPSPSIHLTGHGDPASWGHFLLDPEASASPHPPQPVENPVIFSSLLPSAGVFTGTSFDPSLPLPTALPQWVSAGGEGPPAASSSGGTTSSSLQASGELNTTFGTLNLAGVDVLSDTHASPASVTDLHSTLPSGAAESHDAADDGHEPRGDRAIPAGAAGIGVASPDSPTTGLQPSKTAPEKPPSTLSIVHYKPRECVGERTSKKRPLEEEATQGMASQTLRRISLEDENGQIKGTLITFGKRAKSRAAFSEEKRLQTAQARKEGVCGRCKRSKRQCDLSRQQSPYVSCTLCACTRVYKNTPRMPCFRATLEGVLFYRSGPATNEPFFTERRTVYDLGDLSKPGVPVRTLELTQNFGSHHLTVYAAEFDPLPGDVTSYRWRDASGEPCATQMPNFCLTNIEKVHGHLRQYIESAKWSYFKALQTEKDELAWMTVSAAVRYAMRKRDTLVADTLNLWAVSRMIEVPWEICGSDTLGIHPITHFDSPQRKRIPIPPTMDTQLDQIVIQRILNPLRAKVVRKFEQLITPAKPEAWFEVYLSAFILLNHIERLAKHSVFHARRHVMPSKYSNIAFLEAAFHTAKSILARFHFVCNGSAPLRLNWKSSKAAAMARLEPSEVEFMQKTQSLIAKRETDILEIRKADQYEAALYWGSQLFFENWDTSPVHVVDSPQEVSMKPEA